VHSVLPWQAKTLRYASPQARLCHSSSEADEQVGPNGSEPAIDERAGAKGSVRHQSTHRTQGIDYESKSVGFQFIMLGEEAA
jgi:hypothetical protein